MKNTDAFLMDVYKLDIIKFGNYTLKSGAQSPFYIDLRAIASNPVLLKSLSNHLLDLVEDIDYQRICGVPYAALPIATVMSVTSNIPLIIKRKENKGYGTNKLIEGNFEKGQSCLLVEDVVTSGKSLLETIAELEKEGIVIKDILVVIDRQQGGTELLKENGYNVHALFTIRDILQVFHDNLKINRDTVDKVLEFIEANKTINITPKKLNFKELHSEVAHPVGKKLIEIALEKKSNLISSMDVTSTEHLLELSDKIGPEICALKVHADIISDFSEKTISGLKELSAKHNFLIIEDRKFADIGNTALLQFTKSIHRISDWADLVTIHVTAGEASVVAIKNSISQQKTALIPIVEMSTVDTLTDIRYVKKAINIVGNHPDAIVGAVAQGAELPESIIKFTPGVRIDASGDDLGQNYSSPENVISKNNTHFIIVGRGIYQDSNPLEKAKLYKNSGWNAYLNNFES